MPSTRDHLFPATSIGRTQGARLQRVPSSESLTAHPLLSSNHSSAPSADNPTSTSPRYIPYTPRQRVSPTSATTGTTVHPPSPQHQQGEATSKLQLVHLKAAAQNIGLDTGSVGWAILERLVSESDHHDAEWTEVWTAVTTGKATLLLPLEQAPSHDKLTPEFVKDHIILCDGPSRKDASIVALSGLRAVLNNKTLTFRSSIHPSSKIFQDLLAPSSRPVALAVLPDLPTLPSTPSSYPTFSVTSQTSSLPLPPRTPSPNLVKPPLPPRPGVRAVSSSSTTTTTSRIANPFASLFGGSSSSLTFPKAPAAPVTPVPGSPTGSILSFDSHTQPEPVVNVSAFTIDRRIVRKDVAKEMNKVLRKEMKDALGDAALPAWVVDRVHEFTAEWYPFVRDKTSGGIQGGQKMAREGSAYGVAWIGEAPENTAARMQDFYLGLEQDLRVWVSSFLGKGKKEKEGEGEKSANGGVEDERRVREKIDSEAKIKEVMDAVERTICSLFYDRLYMQPTSDDSSHDEALSSRVAALNMLDLGLEHLDIHVESAGPELDLVVQACGEMLSQLETCRSPGDKAAVLVAAHKIVVDGLARLPPIRLMSEEESKAQKSKSSTISKFKAEAPPRDADGALRILMPLTSEPTVTLVNDDISELEMPEAPESDLMTPHAPVPVPASQASPIPTIIEPQPDASADTTESWLFSTSPSHSPTSPTRSRSPVLTVSPAPEATPVSGDVLLPMIIFSVVKANPSHLVSNLLYTQRYRNQSVGGEESYCLINVMAVAEFLENVDLAALGLGDSDKVLSAADLTPIPINRSPIIDETPLAPVDAGSLRGRVEQANKVLTGVVDTSFGMLRSLLPNAASVAPLTPPVDGVQSSAPWNAVKPGFGLLRRESGFSIKSITAALPINRGPRPGTGEESGQQLVTVSRPGSIKSLRSTKMDEDGSGLEDDETEESSDDEDDEDGEADEDEEEDGAHDDANGYGDARSIRSFESMLSAKGRKKNRMEAGARKSLTDRLAHMSSLAALRGSPPTSRRTSLLPPASQLHNDTPASSRPQSPAPLHLAPPIQRFVDCSAGDLRLSEVGELLRDYRRIVEGIRAVGGFDE